MNSEVVEMGGILLMGRNCVAFHYFISVMSYYFIINSLIYIS